MTTARQIAANRANARKSTGPRTAGGKARSAANATRHGVTRRPDHGAILAIYRALLDDENARLQEAFEYPCRHAALRLAEAEVRLGHVRRVEKNHYAHPPDKPVYRITIYGIRDRPVSHYEEGGEPNTDLAALVRRHGYRKPTVKLKKELDKTRENAWCKRSRLLLRYRAEAEAQRTKALDAWIEIQDRRQESKSRNEASLYP